MLKVEDGLIAAYVTNRDSVMSDNDLCEALIVKVGEYTNHFIGETVYFRRTYAYGNLNVHLNHCHEQVRDRLANYATNCMVSITLIPKSAVLATNNAKN